MIRDSGPPPAHGAISTALARSLLETQLPHLAHHGIGNRFDGWDMVVFRLGDALALRLPRVAQAVAPLEREVAILTTVAREWTFPCPRVAGRGEPQGDYPWPWAVMEWLPGETADSAPLGDSAGRALGAAFAQVHSAPPATAWHNPEQSIPLIERLPNLEWALGLLADARGPAGERLAMGAVWDVWEQAVAAPGPRELVWSHADPHGSNVLGVGGEFAGIIDWGKMAACERAVDLSFLYTSLSAAGVRGAIAEYREATGCDDPGLEARIAGIAVTKCASWAVLDRPLSVAMAWRGFAALGLTSDPALGAAMGTTLGTAE